MCKHNQNTDTLAPTETVQPSRLELNNKRLRKIAFLRGKNLDYRRQLVFFRRDVEIDCEDTNGYLDKYEAALGKCCSRALGQCQPGDSKKRVAVKHLLTCNHRLCTVCNSMRAKKLRSKYYQFFSSVEPTVLVKPKQLHFVRHLDRFKQHLELGGGEFYLSGKELTENFRFMHLTLTVPHTNGTWNGKSYYAKEMLAAFNTMRKRAWWQNLVFAGEATVETTQSSDNGLHIHIHALLVVSKEYEKIRNLLYSHILTDWNELTLDNTKAEKPFSLTRQKGILESLNFCTEREFYRIFKKLDSRGSTMVGLTNLYKPVNEAEFLATPRADRFWRGDKMYAYNSLNTTKDLVKGVLECLKYHFEPFAIENDNGELNVCLLTNLLPNIYRQRLYTKFGAFYGQKMLNVTDEALTETDVQEFLENAQSECFCPITSAPVPGTELQHIVFDIGHLVFNTKNHTYRVNPRAVVYEFDVGISTRHAVCEFIEMVTNRRIYNMQGNYMEFSKN